MRQLQVHIAVGGVRMNVSAGLEDFDITVYRAQVFHRHFHALVLRIASGDRDGVRLGVNLDGNTFKIGLLVFRGLYRADFNLVAVPALYVHSSVDVLQLKGTAGLEWIGLIKLLADGEAGNGPNNG